MPLTLLVWGEVDVCLFERADSKGLRPLPQTQKKNNFELKFASELKFDFDLKCEFKLEFAFKLKFA